MNDLTQLVGLGGAPLCQALVEGTKATFPSMPSRWYPALSVTWGVLLNLALAYLLRADLATAVLVGVVTGLFACKLFTEGKKGENSPQVPHG